MVDVDQRPVSSAASFRTGLVLDGRYRLERLLGEGGMGTVWIAEQLALQRKVAVKSLLFAGQALRARLKREALALASVHHPAVVQVYDYGETGDGTPYVVMELVDGESLAARLARGGALPVEEAVALVIHLLEGLAAAHGVGIIHRDIKPANVLLAPGPGGITPRLLDFGIALVERSGDPRLTADGGLIGTPAYMAPEQVRGEPADERTDVWSVGTLLYELIAGEPPFAADNILAVLRRVVEQPPPYPRSAFGLDGRLWSILMSALRKAPSERATSALALRDALRGWLAARGAQGPRATPSAAPHQASHAGAMTLTAAPAAPSVPRSQPAAAEAVPPSFDELIRRKLGGG